MHCKLQKHIMLPIPNLPQERTHASKSRCNRQYRFDNYALEHTRCDSNLILIVLYCYIWCGESQAAKKRSVCTRVCIYVLMPQDDSCQYIRAMYHTIRRMITTVLTAVGDGKRFLKRGPDNEEEKRRPSKRQKDGCRQKTSRWERRGGGRGRSPPPARCTTVSRNRQGWHIIPADGSAIQTRNERRLAVHPTENCTDNMTPIQGGAIPGRAKGRPRSSVRAKGTSERASASSGPSTRSRD